MNALAHSTDDLARLVDLRGGGFDLCAEARRVVLLSSSSRGGSSMLSEVLRRCTDVIHLRAELGPFLRLAGYDEAESDALGAEARGERDRLSVELSLDAGNYTDAADPEAFALDVAWRLLVQWPAADFGLDDAMRWVTAALADPRSAGSSDRIWLAVLARARREGHDLCPWFYDLPPDQIAAAFAGLQRPVGPPGPHLLEEPPFVAIRPWRRATVEAIRSRPLLIKTPSNAYRLPFLRRLFPRAEIRILHLVRQPAAALNGLYDGWRFGGFHSYPATDLRIAGYTDVRPGDAGWWKYDRPPGWRAMGQRPLLDVCAFQWAAAHRAILDWVDGHAPPYLCVRFEDTLGPDRLATFRRIAAFLGVELTGALLKAANLGIEPVMATARPRAHRWRDRADLVGPYLDTDPVATVAERIEGRARGH